MMYEYDLQMQETLQNVSQIITLPTPKQSVKTSKCTLENVHVRKSTLLTRVHRVTALAQGFHHHKIKLKSMEIKLDKRRAVYKYKSNRIKHHRLAQHFHRIQCSNYNPVSSFLEFFFSVFKLFSSDVFRTSAFPGQEMRQTISLIWKFGLHDNVYFLINLFPLYMTP